MIVIRLLFLPFTLLYALGIALRNFLYQSRIYTRTRFDFPIICVGNLSVGGTGKTPHIEWLIRALQPEYKIAVLSRGYKRKTSGYVLANEQASPATIGDEPFQIKQKFEDLAVAVCENRVLGVPNLLADVPDTQMILMDDGFQHLPIRPGYSIILTDYHNLFTQDWLMPSGTLREFRSAKKRAQCIIVSKCPADLSPAQQQTIIEQIRPLPDQLILFSRLSYGDLQPVYNTIVPVNHTTNIVAFSGIARNQLFAEELGRRFEVKHLLSFRDHKEYDDQTLSDIALHYRAIASDNKIIVTTEKDAVKLQTPQAHILLGHLPVYYLPVQVEFFGDMGEQLLAAVKEYTDRTLAEK